MPRESEGSTDELWSSFEFSLALDNLPCHAPLAFGQYQRSSLSDYFMTLKGFKAFKLFHPPFTDIWVEVSAQLGSSWDEKSPATALCYLSWNSPAGLFPTVAEHTRAV